MKEILKVIIVVSAILTILNIIFYSELLPFVKQSVGSHNGKENYVLIPVILSSIVFIYKGGIGLYKKNYSKLNLSLILIASNLLIWFLILNNVECINCSLV